MLILKKERYVIKKCKEYIEGKLEFNSFWNEYLTNKIFIKYIGKVARKHNYGYIDEYDIVEIQKKIIFPFLALSVCSFQLIII